VLDARNKKNYDEAHIAGAELPLEPEFYTQMDLYKHGILPQEPDHIVSLKKKLSKFSKDQPIMTYCNSNYKASTYALFDIKKLGYTNVRAMEEGIEVWQAKGYPVEVAAGE
jgi:rhodanese-related sulfurtransferase